MRLLGYSIEEAYCRLELDFARVGSSRSNREKLPTDEEFHIRRGFFSHREEIPTNKNRMSIIQLIYEFSLSNTLPNNRSGCNCLTEII